MIEVRHGGATDIGRVRSKNQDAWFSNGQVFAVADGMGGHQGGEVASRLAVQVLADEVVEHTAQSLMEAAHHANDTIFAKAEDRPDLRGMGTTLCAMSLVVDDDGEDEVAVINVGDSRMYLLRDGELIQVTRDHSLVEDMRASGQITAAEAAVHPHRNIVTRALGIAREVDIDEFSVIPRTGDHYVICSDGLFNEVSGDLLTATLRRLADPQDAASELVRLANTNGGRDNVTVVVVEVLDDAGRDERAALAGTDVVRRRPRSPDVAGITTAEAGDTATHKAVGASDGTPSVQGDTSQLDDKDDRATSNDSVAETAAEKGEKKKRRGAEPRLRRLTWRTLGFVVLLLAILAAAAGAVGWYSRGTYFVGYTHTGQVTIYKGRPGGFLWFKPTVEKEPRIAKAQVPQLYQDALTAGKQFGSLAAANKYVAQMRSSICSYLTNGGHPAEAVPGAPPTTLPPACADLVPATTTTSLLPTPPTTATPAPTTKAPGTPTPTP